MSAFHKRLSSWHGWGTRNALIGSQTTLIHTPSRLASEMLLTSPGTGAARVLRPGGTTAILGLVQSALLRELYEAYSFNVIQQLERLLPTTGLLSVSC